MTFNPWFAPDQDDPLSQSKVTKYVYMGLSFTIGLVTFLVYIFVWYLCTRHRRARNGQPHPITGGGGLSKSALAAIPVSTYLGSEKDATAAGPDCAICISQIQKGENVRQLPKCNHLFHVDCIDMWLYSHSTCPICCCEIGAKEAGSKKSETRRVAAIPLVAEPMSSPVLPMALPPV